MPVRHVARSTIRDQAVKGLDRWRQRRALELARRRSVIATPAPESKRASFVAAPSCAAYVDVMLDRRRKRRSRQDQRAMVAGLAFSALISRASPHDAERVADPSQGQPEPVPAKSVERVTASRPPAGADETRSPLADPRKVTSSPKPSRPQLAGLLAMVTGGVLRPTGLALIACVLRIISPPAMTTHAPIPSPTPPATDDKGRRRRLRRARETREVLLAAALSAVIQTRGRDISSEPSLKRAGSNPAPDAQGGSVATRPVASEPEATTTQDGGVDAGAPAKHYPIPRIQTNRAQFQLPSDHAPRAASDRLDQRTSDPPVADIGSEIIVPAQDSSDGPRGAVPPSAFRPLGKEQPEPHPSDHTPQLWNEQAGSSPSTFAERNGEQHAQGTTGPARAGSTSRAIHSLPGPTISDVEVRPGPATDSSERRSGDQRRIPDVASAESDRDGSVPHAGSPPAAPSRQVGGAVEGHSPDAREYQPRLERVMAATSPVRVAGQGEPRESVPSQVLASKPAGVGADRQRPAIRFLEAGETTGSLDRRPGDTATPAPVPRTPASLIGRERPDSLQGMQRTIPDPVLPAHDPVPRYPSSSTHAPHAPVRVLGAGEIAGKLDRPRGDVAAPPSAPVTGTTSRSRIHDDDRVDPRLEPPREPVRTPAGPQVDQSRRAVRYLDEGETTGRLDASLGGITRTAAAPTTRAVPARTPDDVAPVASATVPTTAPGRDAPRSVRLGPPATPSPGETRDSERGSIVRPTVPNSAVEATRPTGAGSPTSSMAARIPFPRGNPEGEATSPPMDRGRSPQRSGAPAPVAPVPSPPAQDEPADDPSLARPGSRAAEAPPPTGDGWPTHPERARGKDPLDAFADRSVEAKAGVVAATSKPRVSDAGSTLPITGLDHSARTNGTGSQPPGGVVAGTPGRPEVHPAPAVTPLLNSGIEARGSGEGLDDLVLGYAAALRRDRQLSRSILAALRARCPGLTAEAFDARASRVFDQLFGSAAGQASDGSTLTSRMVKDVVRRRAVAAGASSLVDIFDTVDDSIRQARRAAQAGKGPPAPPKRPGGHGGRG